MFKNAIVHVNGDEYAFWTSMKFAKGAEAVGRSSTSPSSD